MLRTLDMISIVGETQLKLRCRHSQPSDASDGCEWRHRNFSWVSPTMEIISSVRSIVSHHVVLQRLPVMAASESNLIFQTFLTRPKFLTLTGQEIKARPSTTQSDKLSACSNRRRLPLLHHLRCNNLNSSSNLNQCNSRSSSRSRSRRSESATRRHILQAHVLRRSTAKAAISTTEV